MSTERMKITPNDLSVAAVKAAGTANASVPKPVTPPITAGTSPIDAAAGLAAGAVTTLTTTVDAADVHAATTQAAALTESPPVLEQQDQQGADDIIVAGAQTKTIKFPTLKATAPAPGGITSV